jgi:LEA14-like dessication related protein
MPWKIASVLLLTISVASAGLFMEESLRMRDCKVEILDFKVESTKAVLKLKITNPTLFPLNLRKIEVHQRNFEKTHTLGVYRGKLTIQPKSHVEVYIPVDLQALVDRGTKYGTGGTVYVTGVFGDATIPFSMGFGFR